MNFTLFFIPGLHDSSWIASCNPSWLAIVDVFHIVSGVVDLLLSWWGTLSRDLTSGRGQSVMFRQSHGMDHLLIVLSKTSPGISAAAVSDHLLWTFVKNYFQYYEMIIPRKPSRWKARSPAEEIKDKVKVIYDNFARTGASTMMIPVAVSCIIFRNIAEGRQYRILQYRFASRSILPFHLKETISEIAAE